MDIVIVIDIVTTTTAFTYLDTKGKNTGFLLLTLTICDLVLHSGLFIEIQLKEFTLS